MTREEYDREGISGVVSYSGCHFYSWVYFVKILQAIHAICALLLHFNKMLTLKNAR